MTPFLTDWYKRRILPITSFLSSDVAIYSDSMSFLSILTFIPFMMLGVFAAVNISFFADYFILFRNFLYQNMFEGSAQTILQYLNIFLQNSSKLGFFGLLFAFYSVYVFIKQLDYCIHRLANDSDFSFGAVRFLKYFIVMGFATLSVSISMLFYAIQEIIKFDFLALIAVFLQMWFAFFFLFYVIPPVRQSAKKAAIYSFLCTMLLSIFKKLFFYYVLFGGAYGTIYGSFAALFWFFVWLNLSWYIFFLSIKMYTKDNNNIFIQK